MENLTISIRCLTGFIPISQVRTLYGIGYVTIHADMSLHVHHFVYYLNAQYYESHLGYERIMIGIKLD